MSEDYRGQTGYETGSGLANLYKIFRHLRDPHETERKRLMDQIRANPELAQALRDNPEVLKMQEEQLKGPRFLKGLGKSNDFASYIKAMPMSPEAVERQRIQGAQGREILGEGDGFNVAQKAMGMPGGGQLPNVKASEGDVTTLENYRKKLFGSPTRKDTQEQDLELKNKQQNLEVGEQQKKINDFNLADAQTKKAERDRLKQIRDLTLKSYKSGNLWDGVRNGKFSNEQLQALYDDEGITKVIDDQRSKWALEQEISARKALATDSWDLKKILAQRAAGLADDLSEKTGVNFQDLYDLKSNPEIEDQVSKLTSAPTDPKLARLWEAKQKLTQYYQGEKSKEKGNRVAKFAALARPLMDKKKSGRDLEQNVQMLNFLAVQNDLPITFEYKDTLGPGGKIVTNTNDVDLVTAGFTPEPKKTPGGTGTIQPKPKAGETEDQAHDRWNKLGNKYRNETTDQITARFNRGEQ